MRKIITSYIDSRLGRSGYPELKYAKTILLPTGTFSKVLRICAELQSDLRFSNTLDCFRKFGVSRDTFQVALDQLLIGELNWACVLSIVALSGSLAVQCAEKGEEKKTLFKTRLHRLLK